MPCFHLVLHTYIQVLRVWTIFSQFTVVPVARPSDSPQFDMTACAADDHLSIIATAATSDGGVETTKPTRRYDSLCSYSHDNTLLRCWSLPKPTFCETNTPHGDAVSWPVLTRQNTPPGFLCRLISRRQTLDSGVGAPTTGNTSSTRAGRPSSSLHLWDAETMSLLGTLLLPCLALTRDLANAAAAFSVHTSHAGTVLPRVDPVEPLRPPLAENHDRHCSAASNEVHSGASVDVGNGTRPQAESSSQPLPAAASKSGAPAVQQQRQPAAGVKAGTGLSRPVLVTALECLSPYPLVMAASTGGAVVVWRTSDCVCAQVRADCEVET